MKLIHTIILLFTLLYSFSSSADVLLDDFTNHFGGPNDQCHIGEAFGYATYGLDNITMGKGMWKAYTDTLGTIIANSSGTAINDNNIGTLVKDSVMHVFLKTHLSSADMNNSRPLARMQCNLLGDSLNYVDFSNLSAITMTIKGSGKLRIALQTKDIYDMTDSIGVRVDRGYYGFDIIMDSSYNDWKEVITPVALLVPEPLSPADDSLWTWDHGKSAVKSFILQAIPDEDTLTKDSTELFVMNISLDGLAFAADFGFVYTEPANLRAIPGDNTHFIIDTTVTLAADSIPSVKIFYTTDGTTPDTTNSSQVYTAPFIITDDSVVVKAVATNSSTLLESKTWTYYQDVIPVVVSADPGNGTHFELDTTVTFSSIPSDATIHYTLDGKTPTSASPLYTGPITLNQSVTVNAVAYRSGYIGSYGTWNYICDLLASWIHVVPEDSTAFGDSLAIYLTTNADTILYTTDGSDPLTGGIPYTGPFIITGDTVIVKAVALGTGFNTFSDSWIYYGIITGIKNNSGPLCRKLTLTSSAVSGDNLFITVGIPNKNKPSAVITLYNPAGRTISEKSINGYGYHRIRFNKNAISKGVYFLRLVNGRKILNRRIFIQ